MTRTGLTGALQLVVVIEDQASGWNHLKALLVTLVWQLHGPWVSFLIFFNNIPLTHPAISLHHSIDCKTQRLLMR